MKSLLSRVTTSYVTYNYPSSKEKTQHACVKILPESRCIISKLMNEKRFKIPKHNW